jgi:type IV pilus assembly protein PilQ
MLCFLLIGQVLTVHAQTSEQAAIKYTLNEVKTDVSDDSLTITMVGTTPPAFSSRELYDPYRLVVDIAEATMAASLQMDNLLPENKFASLQTTIVRGTENEITRFVFTVKDGYRQTVERKGNDLVVSFLPMPVKTESVPTAKTESVPTAAAGSVKPFNADIGSADTVIKDLIDSSSKAVEKGKTSDTVSSDLEKSFDFSGYKRERISIDFYKIDLHNVFRLLRQVSGLNLIVDSSVSGSITVALKDVPWDFALDIILNLADLKKEEKFNTIIVYPKAKEFEWPQRATDNLSFQTNLEVVAQEALIIEQSANQPKEIMQAKELMRKGRIEEKNNDYEDAAALYVQAAELWPTNSNLTTKLAALYLVRLGMNAKGVFYAQKSLEIKPDSHSAALYAAIGMANMNRIPEAVEYFNRSISGTPPMKEALASFAAFSESNGRSAAALKLYEKYDSTYGETINTMVAKARIYDALNMKDKAIAQYKAILASGFQLSIDLKRFIESRLAEAGQ